MANQAANLSMQLGRIEGAKETLLDKVLEMGLSYYDPEEGTPTKRLVTDGDKIDVLATAVYQIPYYPHGDSTAPEDPSAPYHANTDGIRVIGKNVHVDEGYYSGLQIATVQSGAVAKPVITVDPDTGKITATAAMTEGYISDGTATAEGQVQHTNLTAENIKDGTTIFGIEGTFTSDANALSNTIVEGFSAYVKGARVDGTIPDYGDMGTRTFNPLVDDYWSIDVPVATGAVVKDLMVGLSDELFNRLAAI